MTIFSSIIGALGLLTAILMPIWQRRVGRKKKALSYSILSNIKLLGVDDEYKDRLQVFFDNEAVNDVNVVLIKVFNSGNVPIVHTDLQTDYSQPVRIKMKSGSIIAIEKVETIPPDIADLSLTLENSSIASLTPMLMNPGDSVTIKLITTEMSSVPEVNAHIMGVKQIEHYEEVPNYFAKSFLSFALAVITFLLLVVLAYPVWQLISTLFTASSTPSAQATGPLLQKLWRIIGVPLSLGATIGFLIIMLVESIKKTTENLKQWLGNSRKT